MNNALANRVKNRLTFKVCFPSLSATVARTILIFLVWLFYHFRTGLCFEHFRYSILDYYVQLTKSDCQLSCPCLLVLKQETAVRLAPAVLLSATLFSIRPESSTRTGSAITSGRFYWATSSFGTSTNWPREKRWRSSPATARASPSRRPSKAKRPTRQPRDHLIRETFFLNQNRAPPYPPDAVSMCFSVLLHW